MAEIIHPSKDQFNVAGSRWQITKHASGQVAWEKPGGSLGLIADNDGYLAAFEAMFPLLVVRWGPGQYRLSAVVGGSALGRLANLSAFWEAPDQATANQAKKEIMSGLMEPSFVTRTTRKDSSRLPLRTHTGTLQEGGGAVKPVGPDLNQAAIAADFIAAQAAERKPIPGLLGYGNVVGEQRSTDFPVAAGVPSDPNPNMTDPNPNMTDALAPEDAALMQTLERTGKLPGQAERVAYTSGLAILAGALRCTLIKRQLSWGDRLLQLAERFADQEDPACRKDPLDYPRPPLEARFHVGGEVITDRVDSKILYPLAAGNRAHRAYLDWFAAYQELERQLLSHRDLTGNATDSLDLHDQDRVRPLLHSMVYDATTLYRVEGGQASGCDDIPDSPQGRAEAVRELCAFIALKDADYGQAIRRYGMPGLLTRLFDKFSRLTTLASRADRTGSFESLQDTCKDLLAYSLMSCAFWDEQLECEIPALGV